MAMAHAITTYDAELAEVCAQDVVACIESFVDILRREFPASIRGKQRNSFPDQRIMLYSRIKEDGLVRRVQSIASAQEEKLGKLSTTDQTGNVTGLSLSIEDTERYQLVHNVLLPLVGLLTQCYSILDGIPAPQLRPIEKASRRNIKPAPPAGMLSIQNYTDIACLLEFLVLTNILPSLDAHVMIGAEDRIKYHLPKSLAGRVPRAALAWNLARVNNLSDAERYCELVCTASTISSLVVLDRFKPMLLPRHLSDLYAATFQAMQLKDYVSQSSRQIDHLYCTLGLRRPSMLNPVLQAKAFQAMLLQGTRTPAWLRQRISPLLSQLACTDLASIIQVFCPPQEAATASQRLGRALATTPSKKALVEQMLSLLQIIFPTTAEISGPAVAILETVWAVLNHWSADTIRSELIELWEKRITESNTRGSQAIHMTVRQIGALFSFVSNASNSLKVLQQLPASKILPHLVRLGSMPSILASKTRDDAKQTLHWISEAIYGVSELTMIGRITVSPQSLLAIAWVHSLEPSTWDLTGNEYCIQDVPSSKDLEFVKVRQIDAEALDAKRIIDQGMRRVEVLLETTYSTQGHTDGSTKLKGICCHIFRLILELHLSMSSLKTSFASLSMVPIFSLPTLFERCAPEDLLLGDKTNATALLSLIKTSLVSVIQCRDSRGLHEGYSTPTGSQVEIDDNMRVGLFELKQVLKTNTENCSMLSLALGSYDDEDLTNPISVASIMLSLLVSVLEYGSTLRSSDEEEMLVSFLPILESLAELDDNSSQSILPHFEESRSEIADVAAYALSLIASRSATETHKAVRLGTKSTFDDLKIFLAQSENDLQSTEPPIRARGVVELGRFTRGYLGIVAKDNLPEEKVSLINVLDENEHTNNGEDFVKNFLINEILKISIGALADKESYVYLAAVQTIVSIGDILPRKIIPLVASAVISGKMQSDSTAMEHQAPRSLTLEQRIKLAEALIFMVKRRAVSEEYIPTLIAMMTFGEECGTHCFDDLEDQLFRSETHKYFIGGVGQEEREYPDTQTKIWEEKDIRLKTGGPIFKSEELHVVRAARASVLATLVSKSAPEAIAPSCKFLVHLINDTLALETSRPVCRAITTLARELYQSTLRELEKVLDSLETEASQMVNTRVTIPFTVALISSDEEALRSILVAKCIGGTSQHPLDDPATSARCKEALAFRQHAEESGLFSCAQLVASHGLSTREYPPLFRVLRNTDLRSGIKVKLSID